MIVIVPVDIINNPSKLFYTSVGVGTGSDPVEWTSSSEWLPGDTVYVNDEPEKVYESISSDTITVGGVSPDVSVQQLVPKWAEVSYINKWSMFDLSKNTYTYSDSTIVLEIRAGIRFDSLAILNMNNITNISIMGTDENGTTVYPTASTAITTDRFIVNDIIRLSTLRLHITISGTGTMSIGSLICGNYYDIGDIQDSVSVDSETFSNTERDDFGNIALIRRRLVHKLSGSVLIDADNITKVMKIRDLVNATPAVWITLFNNVYTELDDYYNSTIILGFYRVFDIEQASPLHAIARLELEEI